MYRERRHPWNNDMRRHGSTGMRRAIVRPGRNLPRRPPSWGGMGKFTLGGFSPWPPKVSQAHGALGVWNSGVWDMGRGRRWWKIPKRDERPPKVLQRHESLEWGGRGIGKPESDKIHCSGSNGEMWQEEVGYDSWDMGEKTWERWKASKSFADTWEMWYGRWVMGDWRRVISRWEMEDGEWGTGDGRWGWNFHHGRWEMKDGRYPDQGWEMGKPESEERPSSSLPSSLSLTWFTTIIMIIIYHHDQHMIITSLSLSSPSTSMMIIMVIMIIIVMSTRVTSLSLSSPTLSLPQHSKWESLAASNWAARQPQYWPCSYDDFLWVWFDDQSWKEWWCW